MKLKSLIPIALLALGGWTLYQFSKKTPDTTPSSVTMSPADASALINSPTGSAIAQNIGGGSIIAGTNTPSSNYLRGQDTAYAVLTAQNAADALNKANAAQGLTLAVLENLQPVSNAPNNNPVALQINAQNALRDAFFSTKDNYRTQLQAKGYTFNGSGFINENQSVAWSPLALQALAFKKSAYSA